MTAHIRQSESALHEGLEEMYEKMGDVTLRCHDAPPQKKNCDKLPYARIFFPTLIALLGLQSSFGGGVNHSNYKQFVLKTGTECSPTVKGSNHSIKCSDY